MPTATASRRKLRSPLKWPGGKSYLARRFLATFPDHRTYIEPFAGGLSVLLNKPPALREFAGDIDPDLVHFWATLRDHADRLLDLAGRVPYTEAEFLAAAERLDDPDPATRALAFLVRNRFSRGGLGKDFAWSDRFRGGQSGDANAWDTIRADLPAIARRIARVEFRHGDAIALVREQAGRRTLVYADPPYLIETRTAGLYAHELTPRRGPRAGQIDEDRARHMTLLGALRECRGAVAISGYRSGLYDAALAGWERHEFKIANHSGQTKVKSRRIECLWFRPATGPG